MLKIIHCADVHLGSAIDSKFSGEKARERRTEVRQTFNRMLDYARSEGVKIILLSGDVFDSDKPLKKDKDFFYAAVRANPDLDFLYLRGNHDSYESVTEYDLENLKCFSGEWKSYSYGGLTVSGIELSAENCTSLYSTLNLPADAVNIVMLHGQTDDGGGRDRISLKKLREKNIDYLALGHIHSYSCGKLDERGVYAYSGCLEGRGFDETGKKGFILLTLEEGKLSHKFVPFACRQINEYPVDVGGTEDVYSACRLVKKSLPADGGEIVRIILTGDVGYDNSSLAEDIKKHLEGSFYFLDVKDRTLRKFNPVEYENDLSLKGEFIRTVLSSPDYDDVMKQNIISCGLKALTGGEVD